ncbi:5-bromo-4-chloroindolyl phosphate hydrolysis family protein [Anaerovorax odorimutans]|uniref:5-bromo-4-chloroindolyl phosphate hydrolysis family protein n=1 Tax=Anaerovorax odorimutans TaxID=109327 RepID=A0ABT1RMU8_9FIRM|nr:5-bromo-4-chloroindolyl phosphate hydrolysis family protein [Anaerovorax odorimutans]MCQ4636516.1 5-bromo-4-chloroindolyl phosphate hydrolysis family protein [Anaerovorax odorimutans]
MDLKDFTDLGNDIGRRVNDAINNMNFDQLNRDIRDKVDQAFYGGPTAGTGSSGFGGINGKLYRGPETDGPVKDSGPNASTAGSAADFRLYRENSGSPAMENAAGFPVLRKLPGRVSGVLMMVIGCALAGGCGIAAIVLGILSATMSSVGSVPAGILGAAAGGFAPLFLAGLVIAIVGTKKYGLTNRFKKYVSLMKGQAFCSIRDLAAKSGRSVKFVCRDLQKMIDKGFFPEGHIDDQKTCFIGTNELYRQYALARDSAAESAKAAAEREKEQRTAAASGETDAQLEQVIAEGQDYIKSIREANDAIYNPDISQKLYRMESIVKKIFAYVRENPEQVGQLRKFMSYYMPTTEKLVNAYREMDEQTIQGENITKAKGEIARTLDTINEAYEKLYDSMYVDVAMDVSSDIAVLKTLFAQEGLAGDEINGGKK